jgi:hypothetical protein
MRRRWAAGAIALLLAAGCGAGQDPGVTPSPGSDVPRTTSNTLPPCPTGGPDASTPAGCVDESGKVVNP